MFGKLLKYEFKSVGIWFFGLYGLAAFISLAAGIWIRANLKASKLSNSSYSTNFYSRSQGILAFILFSLLLAIFIAIFIATLLIIIRRFYNNIFGREGYLTLTLPVSTHKTLLTKLFVAFICTICSGLIFILSFFLLILPSLTIGPFLTYFTETLSQAANILTKPEVILAILSFLLGITTSILEIYFAIALGQLFQDYRGLLAFGFYFLISFVRSTLNILIGTGNNVFISLMSANNSFLDCYHLTLNIIFLIVYGLVFYFGTHYIIKNKLNIQ